MSGAFYHAMAIRYIPSENLNSAPCQATTEYILLRFVVLCLTKVLSLAHIRTMNLFLLLNLLWLVILASAAILQLDGSEKTSVIAPKVVIISMVSSLATLLRPYVLNTVPVRQ